MPPVQSVLFFDRKILVRYREETYHIVVEVVLMAREPAHLHLQLGFQPS